jgi:hypothetical protein
LRTFGIALLAALFAFTLVGTAAFVAVELANPTVTLTCSTQAHSGFITIISNGTKVVCH